MSTQPAWDVTTERQDGIFIGAIERIDSSGSPWIRLPGGRTLKAMIADGVSSRQRQDRQIVGRDAVVAVAGDGKVVLMALIQEATAKPPEATVLVAETDGERVVLTGKSEVVLRCGKSSITLTKAGKIILRGAYISSRSSGVNRIKGGSVQIN